MDKDDSVGVTKGRESHGVGWGGGEYRGDKVVKEGDFTGMVNTQYSGHWMCGGSVHTKPI